MKVIRALLALPFVVLSAWASAQNISPPSSSTTTYTNITGNGNISTTGTAATAADTVTSASANCLSVGPNGATNPTLSVKCDTPSAANGVQFQSTASGGGVTIQTISPNAAEGITVSSVGSGGVTLATGANGTVTLSGGGSAYQVKANGVVVHSVINSGSTFSWVPRPTSTASNVHFSFTDLAETALTASTEAPNVYFNLTPTRQHSTGALTLQRDFRISGSTHSFVGASVLTNLATLELDNYAQAGTNATVTEGDALYIPSQAVSGTVTTAAAINIAAPTGASTNWSLLSSGGVQLASTGTVTPGTNGAACFSSTGQLGANTANCIPSLLRFKQDLQPITPDEAIDDIERLARDAISYRFTDQYLAQNRDQYHAYDRQPGFGAEWVERDVPMLAEYDSDGKLAGVRYEQLTAIHTVALAQLVKENMRLKIGVAATFLISLFSLYRTRKV